MFGEINSSKEELHDIQGSLKHTIQQERAAFETLDTSKDSADNIVDGISNAIVKAEQHTAIHATVGTDGLAKVHKYTAKYIKAENELLEKHSDKMGKRLQRNEGIWLSSRWFATLVVVFSLCYLAIILCMLTKGLN